MLLGVPLKDVIGVHLGNIGCGFVENTLPQGMGKLRRLYY